MADLDMPTVIGDLDQATTQDFVPSLEGFGMEKTVTVFNPLPVDFKVKYTRSGLANAPMTPEMQYTKEKTGLDLSKRGPVQGHVTHTIVLKAKTLTNLPGDIAQIAVRKLVSTIIQTRNDDGSYDFNGRGGNKGMVPDPHLRQEVEQEIVRQIKDTMSLMNRETPEQFTERQINELNEPQLEETPDVPDTTSGTGNDDSAEETLPTGSGQPDSTESEPTQEPEVSAKRKPGRPKKTVAKA